MLCPSFPSSARYGETNGAASPSLPSSPEASAGSKAGTPILASISRLWSAMRSPGVMLIGKDRSQPSKSKAGKPSMRLLKLASMLLLPQTLISCSSVESQPPVVNVTKSYSGCKAFKAITWSPKDTRETVDQIERYSAARRKLCT